MPPGARLPVYLLFLASGATALVYQVAWTREMSLVFGASFEAVSIVLGSFMGGLALGGVFFGRRADHVARPLRLYGLLELGIAAFAVLLPVLLQLVDRLYVAFAQHADGVTAPVTAIRFLLVFGVLLLPTSCMGGTLPILTRYLARSREDFGTRLSGLYAINTLGAVLGTVGAGFFLLPRLGVWRTELVAVAGNVLIGVVALLADRYTAAESADSPADPDAERRGDELESRRAIPAPADARPLRLAFWGTAVAGFGALALEVLWSRAIAITTGTTTYSFTAMLAAFLIGIALGSWLHALVPLRRVDVSVQFGTTFVLIGVSTLAVSLWISRLPALAARLNLLLYEGRPVGVRTGTTLALSFLIMLVPCVFMGVAFPLAGQARAQLGARFGRSVGDLVGLNTLGAIAGSLVAGFVLIPRLGLQRGLQSICCVYLAYGLFVLWNVFVARHPRRAGVGYAAAAVSIVASVVVAFSAVPRGDRLLATFQNNKSALLFDAQGVVDVAGHLERTKLLYHRDGRGASVSVIEVGDERGLVINGKAVASNSPSDLPHELMLGHLPALLHPEPKSALVVGMGAGVTLGAVASHPDVAEITLVEIEPAVLDAARLFSSVNDDAQDDPRVRLVSQDGRNYLATSDRAFDVITADPIHPWTQGAAYLYTVEYYRLAREHLTDDGVMCQWLPLYELSADDLRSIVGSFVEVFAHNSLWQIDNDTILIGSRRPIKVDLERLDRRLAQPSVRRQLSSIGLESPLSFVAELAMDDEALRRFSQGATLNTDDNLHIEFSSPLSLHEDVLRENVELIDSYRVELLPMLQGLDRHFASERQAEQTLATYRWAKSETARVALETFQAIANRSQAQLARSVSRLRHVLERLPDYTRARRQLAGALAALGGYEVASGEFDPGIADLREAIALGRRDALTHHTLGYALQARRQIGPAIEQFRRALEIRPDYARAHNNLANALASRGKLVEAEAHYQRALEVDPGYTNARINWANALAARGRADEAARQLERALDQAGPEQAELIRRRLEALGRLPVSAE